MCAHLASSDSGVVAVRMRRFEKINVKTCITCMKINEFKINVGVFTF